MEEFDEEQQHLTTYNLYAIQLMAVCVAGFLIFQFLNFKLEDIGVSPMLLLLFGAPIFLILAYTQLELTLILFVYTVPVVTYGIPGLPFYFTFADAFLVALVVVWLSRAILKKEFVLYKTFLDRYLFVFIFLSGVSVFNSTVTKTGAFELIQTLEFCVFSYYFFCTVVKKRTLITGIFQALTYSSVFFAIYGIHQYFAAGGGGFRINSMVGHFNAYGAYVAMMMGIIFNLMLSERKLITRWVYLAALGVNFVALILTFSRGAWVATVIGVMASAWLRGLTQFVKVFSVLILFMLMLSMVAPSNVIGRASSITKVEDKTSKGRLRQYKIAYETMQRYPLLGVGITSMDEYVWQNYSWLGAGKIHNLFLWIGAERGVPAMVTLIAIFGVFLLRTREKIEQTDDETLRAWYIGLFSAVLAYFIINLTALQFVRGLGIFLGMFLGLFQGIARMEEEKEMEIETPYHLGRATVITKG